MTDKHFAVVLRIAASTFTTNFRKCISNCGAAHRPH